MCHCEHLYLRSQAAMKLLCAHVAPEDLAYSRVSNLSEWHRRHTRHLFLVEGGDGQGEDDTRSSLGRVLGMDGSAVSLDDGAHDAESQATAASRGLARVIS